MPVAVIRFRKLCGWRAGVAEGGKVREVVVERVCALIPKITPRPEWADAW